MNREVGRLAPGAHAALFAGAVARHPTPLNRETERCIGPAYTSKVGPGAMMTESRWKLRGNRKTDARNRKPGSHQNWAGVQRNQRRPAMTAEGTRCI